MIFKIVINTFMQTFFENFWKRREQCNRSVVLNVGESVLESDITVAIFQAAGCTQGRIKWTRGLGQIRDRKTPWTLS